MLSPDVIQTLPNPHLGAFLPDAYPDANKDAQRALLEQAHLAAARLPPDYRELTTQGRLGARMKTLTSWYDPGQPNVVCNDPEAFVAAMYLWVEHYCKPNPHNVGRYFHRDPIHKYDMVRMVVSAPLAPTEPAKTAFHAPRFSTKTETLIIQMAPMMAICRPHTTILVSEVNATRTAEEMSKAMAQIETNPLIYEDFGGPGALYPKRSTNRYPWRSDAMTFLHHPGCGIIGHSIGAAHRGRHPVVGLIDDPDTKDSVRNPELRRKFIQDLFKIYAGMFEAGGLICLFATSQAGGVLEAALWDIEHASDEFELEPDEVDQKWQDWTRKRFDLIYEQDGEQYSLFPDRFSVETFRHKLASNRAAAMAEYQGISVAEGQYAFHLDEYRHGYMHCATGGDTPGTHSEYMLDLYTGVRQPWSEFLDELYVCGACDIADSVAPDADYGAVAIIGVSPDATIYVLDCFARHLLSEDLVKQAYALYGPWKAQVFGWETGTLQNVVVRMALRYGKMLESQGQTIARNVGVSNHSKDKTQRILATLRPLVTHHEIRLPVFGKVTDSVGDVHRSVDSPHRGAVRFLKDQFANFTDSGAFGHDDVIDALQMAVVVAGRRKGAVAPTQNPIERTLEKFRRAGLSIEPESLPFECWTPEMLREHEERIFAGAEAGRRELVRVGREIDPYD